MANLGQVVAAMSGGALLTITAVLGVGVYILRGRIDQQRRIDSATRAILEGVEEYRRQQRAANTPTGQAADVVDLQDRARMRALPHPAGRAGREAPARPHGRLSV